MPLQALIDNQAKAQCNDSSLNVSSSNRGAERASFTPNNRCVTHYGPAH